MTNSNEGTIFCNESKFDFQYLERYFEDETVNNLRKFHGKPSFERRYEDSAQNTDNAWIEIELINYHYELENFPIVSKTKVSLLNL